jgi:hypothetical protein
VFVLAFLFLEEGMPYWLHCDGQALYGDLRRIQILTSDELSLREDLRGPFNKLEDTLDIAHSLIQSIVRVMERLKMEPPKAFATFPAAGEGQSTEE